MLFQFGWRLVLDENEKFHGCRSGDPNSIPVSRHLNGSRARLDRADLVTVETEAEAGEIKEMASTFDTLLRGSELYNATLEYLHSIDSVSRHR